MNELTRIVILGTGQLGLAIMDELLSSKLSTSITIANRSGRINEPTPTKVKIAAVDCYSSTQVAQLCADADIVFFCVQPSYTQWPQKFPALAQSVVDGIAETNAKLVFGSNVYMYGPTGGTPMHEDLPYAAETRKGKARAEVAKIMLDAHHSGRVPVVIGRASDFYGPRVTSSALGTTLFGAAIDGKTLDMLGDIDLPHTMTYIRDFARALIQLSQCNEAYGRVWHVPSAPTVTIRQFIDLVGDEVGHDLKIRSSGRAMLWILGLFKPEMYEMIEMLYEFEEPFILDHTRYAKKFDVQITPHAKAIAETVAWYAAQTN